MFDLSILFAVYLLEGVDIKQIWVVRSEREDNEEESNSHFTSSP